MVILGIDPGLASTGYGVLEVDGKTAKFLTSGYIRTELRGQSSNRLARIYLELSRIIEDTGPQIAVIESAFSLGRYPKAGILLGMVIGAIHICLLNRRIPCFELTSREIKNAIVGYGGAKKEQVRSTLKKLLNLSHIKSLHASDALACAFAFYLRGGLKSR